MADISNLLEEDESAKIYIFSQSLMGHNLEDYLNGAKHVLEYNGEMIISESVDKYDNVKKYVESLNMKIIKEDYNKTKRWFYIFVIKQ